MTRTAIFAALACLLRSTAALPAPADNPPGPVASAIRPGIAAGASIAAAIDEHRTVGSTNDAEEFADHTMYLGSSDLELTEDSSIQTIGMRWTGVAIPQGATITTAYVQFSAKESQSTATSLVFRGQNADDVVAFTSTAGNISSRPLTAASVAWAPVAWTAGEAAGNQRTPDLRSVIQEIVSRPGWASGHALAIVVTGTGHRTAWAYDGNAAASPLLHVEYSTGTPTEVPPTAAVTVTQLSSPALTVSANGSGSSDPDATPIASYRFTFGDGTSAVTTAAPTAAAQHTYAAAGTYTVTLIVTDTAGNASAPASASITVSAAPAEVYPTAAVTVTQLSSPALTVSANGSGSSDPDATPIASYRFAFGDGSAAVTTTAPTATAQHTYAAAGTYTVTLIVTDTAGNASAPASATITVNAPSSGGTIAVYAGYYDTHHSSNPKPKPNPWKGSSNVVFVGKSDNSSGGWDTSALRIDNLGGTAINGVVVTVDMGSKHFALWGTNSIPAGSRLILAQTGYENFDGSDTSPAGCYSCNPKDCLTKVSSTIPVVHVTIGGSTTNYYDSNQILNTHGVDGAGCPYTGTRNDESSNWQAITSQLPMASQVIAADSGQVAYALPAPSRVLLATPFPNPTHGGVTIRFAITTADRVRLEIFDVAGRLTRASVDDVLEPGTYSDFISLDGAKPGMYYCRLTTAEGTLNRAFVLTR